MLNSYQCYQVLGLQEGASIKEVKAAYRKLALRYHPDKHSSNDDGNKFKVIAEAYHTLKSNNKRSATNTYQTRNDSKKQDFKENSWGARNSDRTPHEDWRKHSRYYEDAYQDFWKYYEQTFWEYYEKVKSEVKQDSEPIEVEKDIAVSVKVDPEKCIACCSCEMIVPTVFHIERNVKVNPKSKVINEQGAKFGKILDAAQTCPTKAISVTDKKSCRRLYPW